MVLPIRIALAILIYLVLTGTAFAVDVSQCNKKEQIHAYLTTGTDVVLDDLQSEVNLILVMDKSGSMEGDRMAKTKEAAKELISIVGRKDRVAVISFDSKASFVQAFTNDKMLLRSAIDGIDVGDRTKYNAALDLVVGLSDDELAGKATFVIFLSDGQPDDLGRPNSILDVVNEINKKNICLYTIGYALDAGNEQTVLEMMAKRSQDNKGCGRYFSLSQSLAELIDAFSKIYYEVSDIDTIVIAPTISTKDDEVQITAKLSSRFNARSIPGFVDDQTCHYAPSLKIALFKDGQHEKDYTVYFDEHKGNYNLLIDELVPGTYDVVLSTSIECAEQECMYLGRYQTSFLIEQTEYFCLDDWENILTFISGEEGRTYDQHAVDIAVLLDTSGSMQGYNIREVKKSLYHLLNRMRPDDRMALVVFNDYARKIASFMSDKQVLKEQIDSIATKGSTFYLPPLEMAQDMFINLSRIPRRDVLIFISDGRPWDDVSGVRFLDEIYNLTQKGICVFTIGYGKGVGENTQLLLKYMALVSEKELGCGQYFNAIRDPHNLDRILGEIYSTGVEQKDELEIEIQVMDMNFSQEENTIEFILQHKYTGVLIPSASGAQCVHPAEAYLSILDQEGLEVKSVDFEYDFEKKRYHTSFNFKEAGVYDLKIKAMLFEKSYGDGLTATGIIDDVSLNTITVTQSKLTWWFIGAAILLMLIIVGLWYVKKKE